MAKEVASLVARFSADTAAFKRASQMVRQDLNDVAGSASTAQSLMNKGFMGLATTAAGFGIAAVNSAASFEQTMANTRAVMGITRQEMEAIGRAVNVVSMDFTAGPQEAAEAYYEVASAVSDASKHMDILRASMSLADAGQASLATTVDGLTSAVNAYGFAAEEAIFVSDVYTQTVAMGKGTMDQFVTSMSKIAGIASNTGVAFSDVGASMALITSKGQPASEAATQLKGLFTELLSPSEKLQQTLKAIGITNVKTTLESEGLLYVLQALGEEVNYSETAFAEMFGSVEALQAVFALTGEDAEDFFMRFETGMEGATEAARSLQMESAAAQWELLKSRIEAATVAAGNFALPTLNEGLTAANTLFDIGKIVLDPSIEVKAPTQEEITAAMPDIFVQDVTTSYKLTIKPGDTAWEISESTGIPLEKLKEILGVTDISKIQPGEYTFAIDALGNVQVNLASNFIEAGEAAGGATGQIERSVAAFEQLDRVVGQLNTSAQPTLGTLDMLNIAASEFAGVNLDFKFSEFSQGFENIQNFLGDTVGLNQLDFSVAIDLVSSGTESFASDVGESLSQLDITYAIDLIAGGANDFSADVAETVGQLDFGVGIDLIKTGVGNFTSDVNESLNLLDFSAAVDLITSPIESFVTSANEALSFVDLSATIDLLTPDGVADTLKTTVDGFDLKASLDLAVPDGIETSLQSIVDAFDLTASLDLIIPDGVENAINSIIGGGDDTSDSGYVPNPNSGDYVDSSVHPHGGGPASMRMITITPVIDEGADPAAVELAHSTGQKMAEREIVIRPALAEDIDPAVQKILGGGEEETANPFENFTLPEELTEGLAMAGETVAMLYEYAAEPLPLILLDPEMAMRLDQEFQKLRIAAEVPMNVALKDPQMAVKFGIEMDHATRDRVINVIVRVIRQDGGVGGDINLPGRAVGGPVLGDEMYLVGEKGPEVFVPTSAGEIVPTHRINDLSSGDSSSSKLVIQGGHFYISGVQDVESLYDQLKIVAQYRGG